MSDRRDDIEDIVGAIADIMRIEARSYAQANALAAVTDKLVHLAIRIDPVATRAAVEKHSHLADLARLLYPRLP